MSNLDDIKESLCTQIRGISKKDAHKQEICVSCRKPVADRIFSASGIREYEISGMCEICWDNLFKESDENV